MASPLGVVKIAKQDVVADHPGFFEWLGPLSLLRFASSVGAELIVDVDAANDLPMVGIKPLAEAGPNEIAFFENKKYLDELQSTRAGACLIAPAFADRLPKATAALVTKSPYQAFAQGLSLFYRELADVDEGAAAVLVSPSAVIAPSARIAPGAVVGANAVIGEGSRIGAGAVIGPRVVIGSQCLIGANCTVSHSLLGDRVILHPGARIGQDGFGFAMGPTGHAKIPQLGRVIISNDVEIGANTTVDRGAIADTVIGEGTKIDNQAQIAHNVVIGRHCIIVAQSAPDC